MIHAIVPFEEVPEGFIDRLKVFDPNPYTYMSPHIIFIDTDKNSEIVARSIGFSAESEHPPMIGIVIPLDHNFSGLSVNDMWAYLSPKFGRKEHE